MPGSFDDDDGFDGHCYSCGRGYNFEVGIMIYCEHCGGRLDAPSVMSNTPEPSPLESLLEDITTFAAVSVEDAPEPYRSVCMKALDTLVSDLKRL